MQDGYILLHRKIRRNKLWWGDKPFTRAQAWIDMLMMAGHNENELLLGNQLIELKRGEFIRSIGSMAKEWGWGVKRVRNFLTLLQNMGQILAKPVQKGTQITILNYDQYQTLGQAKGKRRASEGQAKGKRRATKKECIKECKKEILYHVHLPVEDYQRLCAEFGRSIIDSKIEDLENYIGINPKSRTQRYSDHNRVLRTWLKKDGIKPMSTNLCPECHERLQQISGLCKECADKR